MATNFIPWAVPESNYTIPLNNFYIPSQNQSPKLPDPNNTGSSLPVVQPAPSTSPNVSSGVSNNSTTQQLPQVTSTSQSGIADWMNQLQADQNQFQADLQSEFDRQKELIAKREADVDVYNTGVRDFQTGVRDFLNPISEGNLLGGEFGALGQGFNEDVFKQKFSEYYNPIKEQLNQAGIFGSGNQEELMAEMARRTMSESEAQQQSGLQYLTNLLTSYQPYESQAQAPLNIGVAPQLGDALSQDAFLQSNAADQLLKTQAQNATLAQQQADEARTAISFKQEQDDRKKAELEEIQNRAFGGFNQLGGVDSRDPNSVGSYISDRNRLQEYFQGQQSPSALNAPGGISDNVVNQNINNALNFTRDPSAVIQGGSSLMNNMVNQGGSMNRLIQQGANQQANTANRQITLDSEFNDIWNSL